MFFSFIYKKKNESKKKKYIIKLFELSFEHLVLAIQKLLGKKN